MIPVDTRLQAGNTWGWPCIAGSMPSVFEDQCRQQQEASPAEDAAADAALAAAAAAEAAYPASSQGQAQALTSGRSRVRGPAQAKIRLHEYLCMHQAGKPKLL